MEERNHFFAEGFEVITGSANIGEFENYILCYRKEQQNTDKMFYWCAKQDLARRDLSIKFHLAGQLEEGVVKSLKLNTQTILSEKEVWVFEKTG